MGHWFYRSHGTQLRSAILAAAGVAACMGAMGCSSTPTVVKINAPLAPSPRADEATQLRDWQPSVCAYQSGAVEAWPTRWYYAPNPDYEDRTNYVLDPVMSVVQMASLPVTLIMEPPFAKKVIYAGDVPPPSYTEMPQLPPKPAVPTGNPYPDPLAAPKQRKAPPMPPPPVQTPPTVIPPHAQADHSPATEPQSPPASEPAPEAAPATAPTQPAAPSSTGGDI